MKVNREIRAREVRLISESGEQMGIFSLFDALKKAEENEMDLVEIAPGASPPVCKLIDYDKFRYQQTKREKINRKATHQAKLKEIKFKPNIDQHDLETKIRHAKDFIEKGSKVKFTCAFRGREIMFVDNGKAVFHKVEESLKDVASVEAPVKLLGKALSMVVAPLSKDKKQKEKKSAQSENT